jgi:hypothetical protein
MEILRAQQLQAEKDFAQQAKMNTQRGEGVGEQDNGPQTVNYYERVEYGGELIGNTLFTHWYVWKGVIY